jgi:hypothetical protein
LSRQFYNFHFRGVAGYQIVQIWIFHRAFRCQYANYPCLCLRSGRFYCRYGADNGKSWMCRSKRMQRNLTCGVASYDECIRQKTGPKAPYAVVQNILHQARWLVSIGEPGIVRQIMKPDFGHSLSCIGKIRKPANPRVQKHYGMTSSRFININSSRVHGHRSVNF